jgi:hypothetical protein
MHMYTLITYIIYIHIHAAPISPTDRRGNKYWFSSNEPNLYRQRTGEGTSIGLVLMSLTYIANGQAREQGGDNRRCRLQEGADLMQYGRTQ